jgi:DNA-binding transcriptional LysR family regulator
MNLRQLRYFAVLAEELHFRRAAERLSITQSPLTLAIQELERELGGLLFHRTRRRVELTEAGTAFRIAVREILDKVQAGLETTRGLMSGETRRLRLGVTAAAGLLPFLATAMQRFRVAHPQVRLTLHELPPAEHTNTLQSRELDVCIVRMPLTMQPAFGRFARLVRDGLVVVMQRDHRLRGRASLAVADLKDEAFIVYPKATVTGVQEIVLQLCARRSFSPRIAHEARDTATILGLVAARQGLAIVPSELSRIATPDTVSIPLVDEDAATDLYLVFREDECDSAIAGFCRIVESAASRKLASPGRVA